MPIGLLMGGSEFAVVGLGLSGGVGVDNVYSIEDDKRLMVIYCTGSAVEGFVIGS